MEENKEVFSKLADELGGFGKFQKCVFVLGCVNVTFAAMPLFNFIIINKVLPHR